MANKMFYSLEEAADRLGKSHDEVREMAASGQLQEFRDRDKLMFKCEQVDLLSSSGDDELSLGEGGGSGLELALDDSGGGSGAIAPDTAAKAKEASGISIFDTEDLEDADPSAVTQITSTTTGELTMDAIGGGSGSGLLDLTREGDDTSLGADLLEDVYAGGDAAAETQGASGLFETTGAATDTGSLATPGGMMVAAEPYDGTWSGIAGGLALGSLLVIGFALAATLFGIVGGTNPLVSMVAGNMPMWLGIFGGAVLLLAIVGWLMGRKS